MLSSAQQWFAQCPSYWPKRADQYMPLTFPNHSRASKCYFSRQQTPRMIRRRFPCTTCNATSELSVEAADTKAHQALPKATLWQTLHRARHFLRLLQCERAVMRMLQGYEKLLRLRPRRIQHSPRQIPLQLTLRGMHVEQLHAIKFNRAVLMSCGRVWV